MRRIWVGATALVVVVLLGTLGSGLAAADGDEAFAVVPEGTYSSSERQNLCMSSVVVSPTGFLIEVIEAQEGRG